MILSSTVPFYQTNTGKKDSLSLFIDEYRQAVEFYVDEIWTTNKIDEQNFKLNKYYTGNDPISDLSARALSCAATQAMGIIKSRIKKLQKTQYVIKKKQKLGINISKLQSKYDKLLNKLKKPDCSRIFPELRSLCVELKDFETNEFDKLLVLKSLGKKYGKISIPLKLNRHYNSLESYPNTKRLNSFLISPSSVSVRFDIKTETKKTGKIEGADQGINTCLTLSDGQVTRKDIHGHDLKSIMKKISKKKKGSKGFKKAQEHRTNYINWSIKQLNLQDIKQINLEKLRQVGKGQRKSRLLQSFSYKEIRTALSKTCMLNGVRLNETSNAYRSQRCNQCGFVHKSNRLGEMFKCKSCNHTDNADLNAAKNHRDKLYDLPFRLRHSPNRTKGFFWKSDGLFDVNGLVLRVPVA